MNRIIFELPDECVSAIYTYEKNEKIVMQLLISCSTLWSNIIIKELYLSYLFQFLLPQVLFSLTLQNPNNTYLSSFHHIILKKIIQKTRSQIALMEQCKTLIDLRNIIFQKKLRFSYTCQITLIQWKKNSQAVSKLSHCLKAWVSKADVKFNKGD